MLARLLGASWEPVLSKLQSCQKDLLVHPKCVSLDIKSGSSHVCAAQSSLPLLSSEPSLLQSHPENSVNIGWDIIFVLESKGYIYTFRHTLTPNVDLAIARAPVSSLEVHRSKA